MSGLKNPAFRVYIGAAAADASGAIYLYHMDPTTGALEFSSATTGVDDPSYLAFHPHLERLYVANEIGAFEGRESGTLSAFAIAPQTGAVKFLNRQPSGGALPCYLSIDAAGRYVLVANYSGGSVAVLPLLEDGRLGAATQLIGHQSVGLEPQPQDEARTHSVVLDPANRFAFVANLGFDRMAIYHFDADSGTLKPNDPHWVLLDPGAGPRHFTFHPNGRYAYVINERGNSFTAFSYEAERGALEILHTVSTLPTDFSDTTHCADIHVSPTGKFLYGSNRGHDSIAICAIDADSGCLTPVGCVAVGGKRPQSFAFDPSGTFLLVANADSDNILSFRLDPDSGALLPTGHEIEVPAPQCVKII